MHSSLTKRCRIAFAGLRHSHILALWKAAKAHPECEVTAAWASDEVTRAQLQKEGNVTLTHDRFEAMLSDEVCDVVAVGDVYTRRGALTIAALRSGRHVISDKPICTSLAELDEIERLARENGLSVGCQLDLTTSPALVGLREIILSGKIGRVCTVNITAQHPLRYGIRAAWYFEPGAHGGTINDIGIHAFDLLPWLTGSSWRNVHFAREWNAKASEAPHFKDCAQFLGELENRASCFADVSYLAPDQLGFELPQYWRVLVHGTSGMAETSWNAPDITVVTDGDCEMRHEALPTAEQPGVLQDFLDELAGRPRTDGLTTARVLTASRLALEAQQLAEQSGCSTEVED